MEVDFWQKILLWTSFLIFLASLLLRQETAITQDLGRHLRLGEMIVAGGQERACALYRNCLTYTFPDYPFVNHHWGSEVIFYLIHKFDGFRGIILFKAIVLGLAFTVAVAHATSSLRGAERRGNLIAKTDHHASFAMTVTALFVTFISIQLMSDRLTTRPEIFGYLLFSLLFWILNKSYIDGKRSLIIYIVPVIILIWVNLHISFVFGLILIWAWAIFAILKGLTFPHGKVRPYHILTILTIPLLSTLVTIMNPSSSRGALMPLSIFKDYGYTIAENVTPFFLSKFRPLPEYWLYASVLVLTIGLFLFSSVRKNSFHLLTFLTFSLFPLLSVRHLPFFALVVPPVLVPLLTPFVPRYPEKDLILLISVGVLWILAFTNPTPLSYFKLPPFGLRADSRFDRATQFVKDHEFQGSMWNDYDIGSYLEWAIPEHPIFVDGRPEAFPATFFRGIYIPMELSRGNWDIVVDKYQIQWAFVTLTENPEWFKTWWQMIQVHPNWKIVYLDDTAAVIVRNDGSNRTIQSEGKGQRGAPWTY